MLCPMPLVKVTTSAELPPPDRARALLTTLSAAAARHLGKPEAYVMTCLEPRALMTFAGSDEPPVCYVELKNIGTLTKEQTRAISAELSAEIERALGVDPARTYIEFSDAAPHLWGWRGETFD